MKKNNLPNLINKNYLNSIKDRLKNRSPDTSFNLVSFLSDHTTFLLVLLLVLLICLWRYNLNSKGYFTNTKQQIQKIQKKTAISIKKSLDNIKKKMINLINLNSLLLMIKIN